MSDRPAFRADAARSARLFRAFRTEQADPAGYYTGLARDTVRQVDQYADLRGRVVADIGGGPGYLSAHRTMINGSALCAALAVTERD